VAGHEPRPDDESYRHLLALRTALRRFVRASDELAGQAGLAPAQHQLLLAIRGFQRSCGPTITDISHQLFVRHHSAVELVKRATVAGLVQPASDPLDRRLVRLRLTDRGSQRLEELTLSHLPEVQRLERSLRALLRAPRRADETERT
jgi:DNA-binding MarR family transcriptional regulator